MGGKRQSVGDDEAAIDLIKATDHALGGDKSKNDEGVLVVDCRAQGIIDVADQLQLSIIHAVLVQGHKRGQAIGKDQRKSTDDC